MTTIPIFLKAAEKPVNTPTWLTQEYLDTCAADGVLQKRWEPKVGDWYFCRDLYKIMRIASLQSYYLEAQVSLKTDHGKDPRGHWTCDIYLPEPTPATASA